MIRQDAAMPVPRFCQQIGIPSRSYTTASWPGCPRAYGRAKARWPAAAVERLEPAAAKYAAHWPAWGHRKICALMAAEGQVTSPSTVERAIAAAACSSRPEPGRPPRPGQACYAGTSTAGVSHSPSPAPTRPPRAEKLGDKPLVELLRLP
jgi:hypothetical protein